jgi:Ca2+-binding EF-hand superfamily protein
MVEEMWYDYDIERSGWLNKRETLAMLRDILNLNNQGPPTTAAFNQWFDEFDYNGNGIIVKREMPNFVRKFFTEQERVKVSYILEKVVVELFDRHDLNRNGYLERSEALSMINELLRRKGESPAQLSQFNRIYQEVDENNDGVLSK